MTRKNALVLYFSSQIEMQQHFISFQSSGRTTRHAIQKSAHDIVKGVKRPSPVEVQYVSSAKLEAPGENCRLKFTKLLKATSKFFL
jgi:hypothetical protein